MVLKPAPILKAEAHAEHAATIAAAHRFAERCRAQFSASQVYLFGSRARGDWYRGSDCDVLVISDRFDGEPMWSRPVTMYQVWDGPPGVSIEPVGLTPAEFDAARDKGRLVSYAIADGLIPLLKLADRQT